MKRRIPTLLLETLVRTPRSARVMQRATNEMEPGAAGLTVENIDRIWGSVERLYRTGLHPAISLCVRRRGQIIVNRAIGHAWGNAPDDGPQAKRVLATPETPFNIFSASKSITAMLIHQMDDRGLLHIDDRVIEYIPEFGQHGKDKVTIRHVLSHRAGIPMLPPDKVDLALIAQPDRILQQLCDAEPAFVAGRRLAYHALTGGWVLGEIIQRVTGKPLREVLQKEFLDPLGVKWMNYGVAPEHAHLVAQNAFTGPPVVPPLSQIVRRAFGVDYKSAVEFSNDIRYVTGVVPAGNIIATAEEVSRFYQMLLDGGEANGTRIMEARTIHRAVQEDSWLELDLTLGAPISYGLGFVLGGNTLSIYGPKTPRAFGHLGFSNVFAWADPDRDVSACLMTSGKPLITPRLYYLWNVLRTIGTECR